MDTWTWIAYLYFVLDSMAESLPFLFIMSLFVAVPVGAFALIESKESPFTNKISKPFVWLSFWLLVAAFVSNVFVPSYSQMKTLVGIEIAARTAKNEDAQRIAKKSVHVLEGLLDRLDNKIKAQK